MPNKRGPKQAPRTSEAIIYWRQGMSGYAAARKAGIALSTIYRAIKRVLTEEQTK